MGRAFLSLAIIFFSFILLLGCAGVKKEEVAQVKVYEATPAEVAYGIDEAENASANLNSSQESPVEPAPLANKTDLTLQNQTEEKNESASAVIISEPKLTIQYFYSTICPFSPNATIYIRELEERYGNGLKVDWHNIYWSPRNYSLYLNYSDSLDLANESRIIPMVFFGNTSIGGPEIRERLGREIEARLLE